MFGFFVIVRIINFCVGVLIVAAMQSNERWKSVLNDNDGKEKLSNDKVRQS